MTQFSADSYETRRKLAYACRILAANGQNDTIYGHVSHRESADSANFWMKPSGLGLDEITPELVIKLDLEGKVLEGTLPRHLEFPIHAEILRLRPSVGCVIHTHPLYSIAFSATGQPLRAVSHEGAQFTPPAIPCFTLTSDLIVSRELGEAVARTIGNQLACFLCNHGIVIAADSIEEATVAAINLERACQVQLLAGLGNQPFYWTEDEEALAKRSKVFSPQSVKSVWEYYCRRIGSLE